MHAGVLDAADAKQMITYLVVKLWVDESFGPENQLHSLEECRSTLRRELVRYVESLPRQYCLTVSLPSFPAWWSQDEAPLAPDVSICVQAESVQVDSQVAKVARALAQRGAPDLLPHGAFLRIKVAGYGDFAPDAPAVGEATSLAKQVAYLLGAYGVTNAWGIERQGSCYWTCESDGTPARTGWMSLSLSRMFSCLQVEESSLQFFDTSSGHTLLGSMRGPRTDSEKNIAVRTQLASVRKALAARGVPDYAHLGAAMEWFQDSLAADNQTVAFISACIGVEALIGTEEQSNQMSDRLADRVAFTLGSSRSERERLRQEFRLLLTLRGQLVHGRQRRLAASERDKLRRLQEILDKLIKKELWVLLQNER